MRHSMHYLNASALMVLGITAVTPALAQSYPSAPPQYQKYYTHRGEVMGAPATAAQYAPMPAYQPNGTYQPVAVRVQQQPATTRYAVPVAAAPSVQRYATAPMPVAPIPAAPSAYRAGAMPAYAPTANYYANMAPAAGAPLPAQRTVVNQHGNRFVYGDVQETVPGAKARIERAQTTMDVETSIGIGYRTGELNWNIAGMPDGTSPNVLSELTWDSLQMLEFNAGARYVVPNGAVKNLHMEGNFYYAYATAGDNQDSDYELDNRQNEFSRSNNNAEGSTAWGIKAALGYQIPFVDDPRGWQLAATPLVGYQKHKQRMRMQDANQTVCENAPAVGYACGLPLGPFAGLNSRYTANWSGPFLGAEAEVGYTDEHRLRLRGEYGLMNFDGEGRWNLRADFAQDPSFKHDADGTAFSMGAEYRYAWEPTLGIVFSGQWQSFKADDGIDRTFLAAGGSGETKLNEVEWTSQAYRVGVEKSF